MSVINRCQVSSFPKGKLSVKKPQVSYNGGCSSVAERATVARITGVRFSPSALKQKKTKMKKINILFVCRYNRFRSRIALAYFNKINKNKNVRAKSAGLIKGNPLSPITIGIAKEFGLDIKGKTQGLSSKLMAWQNVTVVVANDVPPQVFDKNKKYGKKVIVWGISDIAGDTKDEVRNITRTIIKNVDSLVKSLEKE